MAVEMEHGTKAPRAVKLQDHRCMTQADHDIASVNHVRTQEYPNIVTA